MTTTPSEKLLAQDEATALAIYARLVRPVLGPGDAAKFVAVAVESGEFVLDANDNAALDRLLARRPGDRVWLMRVGPEPAYRMAGVGRGRG